MAEQLGRTTRLQAVSVIIGTIGEAAPVTLEDDGRADLIAAERILDETSVAVQENGWYFNSTVRTITPGLTGKISIPQYALRADVVDSTLNYVVRGDYLYDLDTNAYGGFTKDVELAMVEQLTFEELPQAARRHIMIRAARVFVDREVGDRVIRSFTKEDEQESLLRLEQADSEAMDANMFKDPEYTVVLNRWLS